MESTLTQLVARLAKAHADQLVSVVLYGSAASGEHEKDFSDINILTVLTEVTPTQLRASEPVFKWWTAEGNPPPLLLSEHEVATSTDCFAIEFHDIQSHHRILHGRDVVSRLTVDNSFYRAQVERELRAKIIRLRTKASSILSDRELLARLLADSISTFCVLFRHALLLHGVPAQPRKRDIIAAAAANFHIDPAPFTQLLDAREGKIPLAKLDPETLLGSYLRECSTVIDAVDVLQK